MRDLEKQLLEAFKGTLRANVLAEDTALSDMLDMVKHDGDETAHNSQFRWEGIDDAFKLKVAGETHEDAMTSAFFQTHNYKYIDNDTFKLSFERELRQRAVPDKAVESALGHIDSLVDELSSDPGEQDSGWNTNLEDMVDVTTNADSRKDEYTEPFAGGGSYPEGDEHDKGKLEGF
mgnify:CR=1 FL=1|tara:strand:+ start:77108 stop:77635 length:528 start_codon:yes stop_codon:yes gene_type:complete